MKNKSGSTATFIFNPVYIAIFSFAFSGLVILITQQARTPTIGEVADKLIYLASGLIIVFSILYGMSQKKLINSPSTLVLAICFLLAVMGTWGIEDHPGWPSDLKYKLWLGFGPYVTIICFLLLPFIWKIYEWISLRAYIKVLVSVITSGYALLVIPSIWQSSKSLIEPVHSAYILNEIFAPMANHWPYSDFIPQYQTFYGFLFLPFTSGMTTSEISNMILVVLTIMNYLTLILGVAVAWYALNKRSIFIAMAIVLPLTCLTQFPNRIGYLGSIVTLLSALSIRILPGLLLICLMIFLTTSTKPRSSIKIIFLFVSFGIFSALVTWQSQDFGLASSVTCFIVVLIANLNKRIDFYKTALIFAGYVLGLFIYPIIAIVNQKSINFDFVLFFVRQFGSGFGSEIIRTPGPVLIILPMIVFLIVVSVLYISYAKRNIISISSYKSSLIGFAFSLWSFFGFTYYLNRSFASGQMQILFLPISISLAGVIGIILNENLFDKSLHKSRFIFNYFSAKNKSALAALFIMYIVTIPVATMILAPNPLIEISRVKNQSGTPSWPSKTVIDSLANAKVGLDFAKSNGKSIAFFGTSANLVETETGISSAIILNSPWDLVISQKAVNISCDYLNKLKPDVLVLSTESKNVFTFKGLDNKNNTLCSTYQLSKNAEIKSVLSSSDNFAERIVLNK
jgi:hypothetical protein